jgi:hypothetical protein
MAKRQAKPHAKKPPGRKVTTTTTPTKVKYPTAKQLRRAQKKNTTATRVSKYEAALTFIFHVFTVTVYELVGATFKDGTTLPDAAVVAVFKVLSLPSPEWFARALSVATRLTPPFEPFGTEKG